MIDTPPSESSPRRHHTIPFFLAAIAILLLLAALFLVLARPGPKVTWLTPAELAQASKPGLLTQWRRKAMNLTAPLWRWYQPKRQQVSVASTILTLPPAADTQLNLGPPTATDTNGMRLWIIPPERLDSLQQKLASLRSSDILTKSVLQTVDGLAVHVNNSALPSTFRGSAVLPNAWFTITPKTVSRSVNLTVAIFALQFQTPSAPATLQTNISPGFRMSLPTTGGLLIDGGNIKSASGRTYWFVISPSILGADGNPIKP